MTTWNLPSPMWARRCSARTVLLERAAARQGRSFLRQGCDACIAGIRQCPHRAPSGRLPGRLNAAFSPDGSAWACTSITGPGGNLGGAF